MTRKGTPKTRNYQSPSSGRGAGNQSCSIKIRTNPGEAAKTVVTRGEKNKSRMICRDAYNKIIKRKQNS